MKSFEVSNPSSRACREEPTTGSPPSAESSVSSGDGTPSVLFTAREDSIVSADGDGKASVDGSDAAEDSSSFGSSGTVGTLTFPTSASVALALLSDDKSEVQRPSLLLCRSFPQFTLSLHQLSTDLR